MKKRLSTKLLAIFMAVLMLVTAVPFAVLAEDDPIAELNSAISNYQSTLQQKHILADMDNAYDAYIAALKAKDAYEYGGGKYTADQANAVGRTLAGYLNSFAKLPAIVTDETVVAPEGAIAANKTVQWSSGNTDLDTDMTQQYSNKILYAETYPVYRNDSEVVLKDDKGSLHAHCYFGVSYGETVLLYTKDGDPARFPLMATVKRVTEGSFLGIPCTFQTRYSGAGPNSTEFKTKKEYVNNNKQDFWPEMRSAPNGWVGGKNIGEGQENQQHFGRNTYPYGTSRVDSHGNTINYNDNDAGSYIDTYLYDTSATALRNQDNFRIGNGGAWKSFSSSIEYIPTSAPSYNTWSTKIPYHFNAATNYGGSGGDNNVTWRNNSAESNITTHYINYQKVLDTVNNDIPSLDVLSHIWDYTEDTATVRSIMTRIDDAYSFNPSTYDYSNIQSAVNLMNSKIGDIAGIKNISATTDANYGSSKDSYASLKSAVKTAEAAAALGRDTYTTSSWDNTFAPALDAVHTWFSNPANLWGEYGVSIPQTTINNLNGLKLRADFTELDPADEQFGKIENNKYTVESLNIVKEEYFKSQHLADTVDRADYAYDDHQTSINADVKSLNDIFAKLAEPTDWIALGTATAEKAIDNTDKYDASKLAGLVGGIDKSEYSVKVDVAGHDVDGLDQTRFMEIALETIHDAQYDYTVKVDGVKQINPETETEFFHWGDSVLIEAKPYTVSTVAGQTQRPTFKYIDKMEQLTVGGNMILTSCDKEAGESGVIKVVGNTNGHVYYVDALEAGKEVVLADLNVIAPSFYKLVNFTVNGKEVTKVTAEAGETIVVNANFEAIEGAGEFGVSYNGGEAVPYKYDSYVKFDGTEKDVKGYKSSTGDFLCVGPVYEFYVAEEINIIPIMTDEEMPENTKTSYVIAQPHISGGKTTIVGSYSNAIDNETVVAHGIILDVNGTHPTELKLADVSNADKVYNYKITSADEDTHQYGLLINGVPKKNFNYVAYVKYMVGGKEVTEYSTVQTAIVEA